MGSGRARHPRPCGKLAGEGRAGEHNVSNRKQRSVLALLDPNVLAAVPLTLIIGSPVARCFPTGLAFSPSHPTQGGRVGDRGCGRCSSCACTCARSPCARSPQQTRGVRRRLHAACARRDGKRKEKEPKTLSAELARLLIIENKRDKSRFYLHTMAIG